MNRVAVSDLGLIEHDSIINDTDLSDHHCNDSSLELPCIGASATEAAVPPPCGSGEKKQNGSGEGNAECEDEPRGGKEMTGCLTLGDDVTYDFADFHCRSDDPDVDEEDCGVEKHKYPMLPRRNERGGAYTIDRATRDVRSNSHSRRVFAGASYSAGAYDGPNYRQGETTLKRFLAVTFAVAVVVAAAAVIGAAVVRSGPSNNVEFSDTKFTNELGDELAKYTDEELLQISESITLGCDDEALETDEGRRGCIALCEGRFCCFDEVDEYGCAQDPEKLCLLYAGCEALVLDLPTAWDVNGRSGRDDDDEDASRGPSPPPLRCTSDEDDGVHSEVYTDDWTEDRYHRCRSWEKKHNMTIVDYWEAFGVDSNDDFAY